eukprot:2201015-Pyramimonas_sp.AAC.3
MSGRAPTGGNQRGYVFSPPGFCRGYVGPSEIPPQSYEKAMQKLCWRSSEIKKPNVSKGYGKSYVGAIANQEKKNRNLSVRKRCIGQLCLVPRKDLLIPAPAGPIADIENAGGSREIRPNLGASWKRPADFATVSW